MSKGDITPTNDRYHLWNLYRASEKQSYGYILKDQNSAITTSRNIIQSIIIITNTSPGYSVLL